MLFASVYAIFSAPRNIVWRLEHRISQGQNRVFFSRRIFEKIHRFTIFPYHEDFAKAISCSANSSSIQIFRSIFCSIFLQKIRLEHNSMRSIAPLSLDFPSLSRSSCDSKNDRTIDRTNTKKLCYLFAITITRVHDTRVTNRIYLAIHRFELFFKPFFLDRLKKKEVGGEKKKRNRFREGTRRAEALNSRNPSRGHGGHWYR